VWEHWIDGELTIIENGPKENVPSDPHVDIEKAIGHHKGKGREMRRAATTTDAPYSMVGDLQVVIEQPRGSIRRGEDWQMTYAADYGYCRRINGADDEYMDVFVGPHLNSRDVWAIDSVVPETGKFDEHKLCIGFTDARSAIDAYRRTYGDHRKVGAVTHMSMDSYQFKSWLASGDKYQPIQRLAA
jgi:hypothetical protein